MPFIDPPNSLKSLKFTNGIRITIRRRASRFTAFAYRYSQTQLISPSSHTLYTTLQNQQNINYVTAGRSACRHHTINKQQCAKIAGDNNNIILGQIAAQSAYAMHLVVVGKSAFSAKIKQIASDANLHSKRIKRDNENCLKSRAKRVNNRLYHVAQCAGTARQTD